VRQGLKLGERLVGGESLLIKVDAGCIGKRGTDIGQRRPAPERNGPIGPPVPDRQRPRHSAPGPRPR